jgi:hypothetical protein
LISDSGGFETWSDAEEWIEEHNDQEDAPDAWEYAIGARDGATTLLFGENAEAFAEQFGGNDDRVVVAKFDETRMLATFAAIGNDGRRPVIWGLGTSPEMAFVDAIEQDGFEIVDAKFLRIEPVGPEVQERVQQGDVSWGAR